MKAEIYTSVFVLSLGIVFGHAANAQSTRAGAETPSQILTALKAEKIVREIKFIKIPFNRGKTAEFDMGCNPKVASFFCGSDDTAHKVRLTQEFEMQETEMTQAQWLEVMGAVPSAFRNEKNCPGNFNSDLKICPNHPVENVSWNNIASPREPNSFLAKFSLTHQDGYEYRLPTEAEWEYAARGGTKTNYLCGDDYSCTKDFSIFAGNNPGNVTSIDPNELDQPADVGSVLPNPFGLYDMAGNVSEWVEDWYAGYYHQESSADGVFENPKGPPVNFVNTSLRAARGGGFEYIQELLLLTFRNSFHPGFGQKGLGFRLVRIKKVQK